MTLAPGLCGRCRFSRTVVNRRGSTFLLCSLSRHDPSFPRYPVLPVLSCAGFAPDAGGGGEEEAAED